jgi:hypothetical protein
VWIKLSEKVKCSKEQRKGYAYRNWIR